MPFAPRGHRAGEIRLKIGLALALAAVGVAGPVQAEAEVAERQGACGKVLETPPGELAATDAERAVQCLVNRRRAQAELAPLRRDPTLTVAAHAHSAFMQQAACFDHLCPGEEPLEVRLSTAGYIIDSLRLWRYGEALAWAAGDGGTPRAIVRRLMSSPPHRDLLLSPVYEEIGAGFRYGTYRSSSEDGGLYTVEVGRRAGAGDLLRG